MKERLMMSCRLHRRDPAEDWEGLCSEDVLAKAKDTSIRRHADCQELSVEQLKVIIAELMPQ